METTVIAVEVAPAAEEVAVTERGVSVKLKVTEGSWWQNPLSTDVADETPLSGQFDFVMAMDATRVRASGKRSHTQRGSLPQ